MLRRKIPSTNSLFTFEVVARLGSFSGAARELNVTQPAVSRAINNLEKHLGYPLFIRHGRWIDLTQNGERLFRTTSTAFNAINETLRQISKQNESHEKVSIAMSPTAVNYWFIPRMQQFRMNFPAVSLDFRVFDYDVDSQANDADLCIRLSGPKEGNTHRWPFSDERILALCSPSYLSEYGTLDEPKKGRLHTTLEVPNQRYTIDEYVHATGRPALISYQSIVFSDYSSIIQAAIQGQGIALGWVPEVSQAIIDGSLIPACTQVVKTGRRYHVLASNLTPMRPVVEDIRDWMIKEMRNDLTEMNTILRAHLIDISASA
ncbi:MAG: LysR family transcriptional regulator [Marinosulfonomonas sp.]|nr:LysR family transcriptional regulator [Marinosulfonomonas sp.]